MMCDCLDDVLNSVHDFMLSINLSACEELQRSPELIKVLDLFCSFCDILRNQHSLSAFWMSYIEMVEVLLGLVRAAREGNWLLHLAMVRKIIPWCFAYDKINYAWFLPYYYATMTRLHIDHPEVYAEFMKGGFSVQIGSKNPFGQIPVDQTIEETVNKDTQTSGGTKGFSLKGGAIKRYSINAEFRSQYVRHLREMVGQGRSKFSHPDLQSARIKKDANQVATLVDILERNWINPFDTDQTEFINLASGKVAPPNVVKNLLQAEMMGEAAYDTFRTKCIEGNMSQVCFHERLPKLKLKTFTDMHKSGRKAGSKQVILNTDRKLFGQMILVAENRNLDMREVLSHPLGPLPWSLACGDGTQKN